MTLKRHFFIQVFGKVQGVGFRPFVYRLALEEELNGWVNNSGQGVNIHLECALQTLEKFIHRLQNEKPEPATIANLNIQEFQELQNFSKFEILKSETLQTEKSVFIPQDLVTCKNCLQELGDPQNRRYRYPFINCTHCGPRFSIIEDIPYDRALTSMKSFEMCELCSLEYHNPLDRRFHAQPNACPNCGPQIFLQDSQGKIIFEKEDALQQAVSLLHKGAILAVKGLGGYQLVGDATKKTLIEKLRQRKKRPTKPLAIMTLNQETAKNFVKLTDLESKLLSSHAGPIVLLEKMSVLPEELAPNNPYLGVLLPTTGLHALLLADFQKPLIVTSGNLSEEPICLEDEEAFLRLKGVADYFLTHNRSILRQVDDSVVRVMNDKVMTLRKARGLAPEVFPNEYKGNPVLCLGGHQKNTITLNFPNRFILSQHIGDLDNELSFVAFQREIKQFLKFYQVKNPEVISDLHPHYQSTLFAQENFSLVRPLQHHLAHVYAVMAEFQLKGPLLGLAWDGSGYADARNFWGGEFFFVEASGKAQRVASFLPMKMLGGEKVARENFRMGYALLLQAGINPDMHPGKAPGGDQDKALGKDQGIERNIARFELYQKLFQSEYQHLETSSLGRLLEGLSAILGLCDVSSFEGEAAMRLEFEALKSETSEWIDLPIVLASSLRWIDWRPLVRFIHENTKRSSAELARISHNSVLRAASKLLQILNQNFSLNLSSRPDQDSGLNPGKNKDHSPAQNLPVVLGGGVFQNKIILEGLVELHQSSKIYYAERVPPNDGALSLGQAYYSSLLASVH